MRIPSRGGSSPLPFEDIAKLYHTVGAQLHQFSIGEAQAIAEHLVVVLAQGRGGAQFPRGLADPEGRAGIGVGTGFGVAGLAEVVAGLQLHVVEEVLRGGYVGEGEAEFLGSGKDILLVVVEHPGMR